MRPGVAAGHPATADVGAEILADGGTAADAVVAMALASCVAETVMSGLLAGCHAIVFDGSRTMNLDGFAAVPSRSADLVELPIAFGDELVMYSIGPASCAVPGLPAALGELWRALGRLPWTRLVEPALAPGARGRSAPARCTRARSRCSATCSRSSAAPSSSCATAGRSRQARSSTSPGSSDALEALAEEGAASVYTRHRSPRRSSRRRRRRHARRPRRRIAPRWREPVVVAWNGYTRRHARRALGRSRSCSRGSRASRDLGETERVLALVDALETADVGGEHTTNMVAVDGARASVRPHALPRRRRRRLAPGLRHAAQQPPRRVATSRTATRSPATTSRAAWRRRSCSTTTGSRSRSARPARRGCGPRSRPSSRRSSTKASTPRRAVARPRVHPTLDVVDAEPGVDEAALAALEERGRTVRRWDRLHHYFGGVSCVGRTGAAGDPRRSGAALASSDALLQQQLVDAAGRDEHPDEPHGQEIRDVDELERPTVPVVSERTSSIPWYSGRQRTIHSSTSG